MNPALAKPSLTPNKLRKGLSSLGWSSAAQLVGLVVKIGSTLVLTRLLAPESYGLIGTALTVITTLEWLSDLGVVPALLRHACGSQREWLLVGWWIGIGRSIGIAASLLVVSMPLSSWYGKPELFALLAVLSMRPIIMAFRSPGMPELRRRLEGRRLFLDEIIQTISGTVVSVSFALWIPGLSAWAIVLGMMAGSLISVFMSYQLVPFRPHWYWDASIAADLAGVGRQILGNTLLMAIWLNSDRLIGPKFLSLQEMGVYIVAWNLAAAAESFLARGTEIYFSLLVRQPDEALRNCWHSQSARQGLAVIAPLLIVAAALSSRVIHAIYDARYEAVGPVLTILLARLIIRLAGQLDFQLLLSTGRIRTATIAYAVGAVAQLIAVPFVASWGAVGLAFSLFGSTCLITFVQTALSPELGLSSWRRSIVMTILAISPVVFAFQFGNRELRHREDMTSDTSLSRCQRSQMAPNPLPSCSKND